MATPATQSGNFDTAYGALETDALAFINAGGSPSLVIRNLMSRLSLADQRFARAIQRRGFGNDQLLRPRSLTLAAADTPA